MKKHGFKRTEVEHHADRSHTVHHLHSDGPQKDVKHAAMDLDSLHDSLQDHLNPPEPPTAPAAPLAAASTAPAGPAAMPAPLMPGGLAGA
jgi:hypothetical protein